MPTPLSPSLYQINTRVWLTELSRTLLRSDGLLESNSASQWRPL